MQSRSAYQRSARQPREIDQISSLNTRGALQVLRLLLLPKAIVQRKESESLILTSLKESAPTCLRELQICETRDDFGEGQEVCLT